MEPRSLKFIAEACGGELVESSPDLMFSRVCTDSRHVERGDLFFALAGEKFDGHNFILDATAKGAACVVAGRDALLASNRSVPRGCGLLLVDDTRKALGKLAARYRKDFQLPMVAVAGSNGKTATKELLASVLRQKLNTLWSEASFNNDIGVPLTLLRLEATHQIAVLEVGTNHPGELSPLVAMAGPNCGVLTCIGREHLEFFGDLEGVAREEGNLAELLPADGKLFVNGDDEWSARISGRAGCPVVRVGFSEGNAWRAKNVRLDDKGASFRVSGPVKQFDGDYRTNLLGRHQITNGLLAIAVGAEFGLSKSQIRAGLNECQPAKMRMQVWDFNGVRVLDDAYNANADSMAAALQTLRDLPCKGRRVAVLGEMAELGEQSEEAHEEVGRRAAELGVGQLFAIGKMAPAFARGARDGGLNRVLEFSTAESAASAVKSFVRAGDLLLLKASRASRLERIAELLRAGVAREKTECFTT